MKNWDKERVVKILFFLYLLVLIKVIIFKYPFSYLEEIMDTWEKGVVLEGLKQANFTPLKTIKMYIRYYDRLNSFENLFGNVIAFVPLGILLPLVHEKSKNFFVLLCNTFLLILGIELFQLYSAFGAFDVDDIILNMAGAIIGYVMIYSMLLYGKWKKQEKR
ncbi:MAG: VanZ family protein [Eubacteriales bacterium]